MSLSPASISKETSEILVRPTLQIEDDRFPHVFAMGDVAATGGPKMGRAAVMQSEVIVHNILTLIAAKRSTKEYKPLTWIEGSIKLTLGIVSTPAHRPDGPRADQMPVSCRNVRT